ncbi:putative short chain type dehydrogenase [Pseudohyphozyma bogoriensis]|nr:putative short chain type dehydrogenase [Pseudohyphozyma bogoriensis]
MTAFPKTLFLIGGGRNVGAAVATLFAKHGYNVAIAARSVKDGTSTEGYLNVNLDASKPETIGAAFEKVASAFGGPPSVVVYNAHLHFFNPDPLATTPEDFASSLTTNITSAYVAAQHAVSGLDKLGPDGLTFIYTGNALNDPKFRMPALMSLGVGKSGAAHFVELAAQFWGPKGAKFYYADQRTAAGGPFGEGISGLAHAQAYYELASSKEQGDALVTFVDGKGAVKF